MLRLEPSRLFLVYKVEATWEKRFQITVEIEKNTMDVREVGPLKI